MGIDIEDVTFFCTNRVWLYGSSLPSVSFKFIYHARTFTPRKNCPSIDMAMNGIDPNNNSGIQRFFHLDMATQCQYLTSIKILKPADSF